MLYLRPALALLAFFTLLTGGIYPLVVTGIAQFAFAHEANGSLIDRDGKPAGSALIGQPFVSTHYFWSRPSVTGPHPYNGAASTGSNLGPVNPALHDAVQARVAALRASDPTNTAPIPIDLVTASGSGLDPHISLAAARYQIARVARARAIEPSQLAALVERFAEPRNVVTAGEPRVNVLMLNLALDDAHGRKQQPAPQ